MTNDDYIIIHSKKNIVYKDYPIRVYLEENGDHFRNMVKQFKHLDEGGWCCIEFPCEEDVLAFSLMFPFMQEPKDRWAREIAHYLRALEFPQEVMDRYT